MTCGSNFGSSHADNLKKSLSEKLSAIAESSSSEVSMRRRVGGGAIYTLDIRSNNMLVCISNAYEAEGLKHRRQRETNLG